MVPIPRIKHGLLHHLGYTAGLMVGRLCVVRLSGCVSIEGLEVHNSLRFSISLPYDHTMCQACLWGPSQGLRDGHHDLSGL